MSTKTEERPVEAIAEAIQLRLYLNQCVVCGKHHYCPMCDRRLTSLLLCIHHNVRFTHDEAEDAA